MRPYSQYLPSPVNQTRINWHPHGSSSEYGQNQLAYFYMELSHVVYLDYRTLISLFRLPRIIQMDLSIYREDAYFLTTQPCSLQLCNCGLDLNLSENFSSSEKNK